MHTGVLLTIYSVLVALASLTGGWVILTVRLTHARLQTAISFVAGLMLGMALLHFIPDALEQLRPLDRVMEWALGGFLTMFFLQRFLPYHHHEAPEEPAENGPESTPVREHTEHAHHEHHGEAKPSSGGLAWLGTALGMSLHSLIDGFALAAAVVTEAQRHGGILVGLGTALVIMLHKPFDAVAVSTVTTASGCSRGLGHLLNALFALTTPLGVAIFYLGASRLAHMDPLFLGAALGFCAGTFLCISCADLLPELQFHSHDRFKLSAGLIAGLGLAVLIGVFEQNETKPAPSSQEPSKAELNLRFSIINSQFSMVVGENKRSERRLARKTGRILTGPPSSGKSDTKKGIRPNPD